MTFQSPQLLWLLAAVVPLVLLWRVTVSRREGRLARFAAPATWRILSPYVSTERRRWKAILLLGAVLLSVVAAARPLWGQRERPVRQRGIDLIVAIDVSASMTATDFKPTRLEQAKNKVRSLLATFPGQRIGIIPFAGEAFLQCPLTADYGIVLDVIQDIDTNTIDLPGTDIGRAIEAARGAFARGGQGTRVLLLITDGEDNEQRGLEQAMTAAAEGIAIYTLGIGTAEGAPLPGAGGRFMEDADGHKILSRLDVDGLAGISAATGGSSYVPLKGQALDIRPLVKELDALKKNEQGEKALILREERFQWPLGLALGLLLVEGFLGERRRVAGRGAK